MTVRAQTLNHNDPVNRLALRWLKQAKAEAPNHYLQVLNLAAWGLENAATGEWPDQDQYVLDDQVSLMFGWAPANVMAWITSNPNGPEKAEQADDLAQALRLAQSPKQAAAVALSTIYSRLQATTPQLQPAASA